MSTKTKQLLVLIFVPILLFLIISLVFINSIYTSMNFLSHNDHETIKTAEEYGLVGKETDVVTKDDVKIHIYEVIVPEPQGVVIMLSGINGPSVTYFYGQAKLVQEAGFASVLVETRGHGKSEGDRVGLAIDDVKDVQAAVDYINEQQQYKNLPIVVMGVSMGGATTINSAATIEDIDASIALSPFSSWLNACYGFVENVGMPRWAGYIATPGIVMHGFLSYGTNFFKYVPEKTIKKMGDKPLLLIQCKDDRTVLAENTDRIMENYTGTNAEVWIRESDEHLVVKDNRIDDPFVDEEYCERILGFLEKVKSSAIANN